MKNAMNPKFWKWVNKDVVNEEDEPVMERTLFLYGTIAEESWFDDDITPAMFKDELFAGDGPITIWINSPGGDCIAASQIYSMLMDYKGDVTVNLNLPGYHGRSDHCRVYSFWTLRQRSCFRRCDRCRCANELY